MEMDLNSTIEKYNISQDNLKEIRKVWDIQEIEIENLKKSANNTVNYSHQAGAKPLADSDTHNINSSVVRKLNKYKKILNEIMGICCRYIGAEGNMNILPKTIDGLFLK